MSDAANDEKQPPPITRALQQLPLPPWAIMILAMLLGGGGGMGLGQVFSGGLTAEQVAEVVRHEIQAAGLVSQAQMTAEIRAEVKRATAQDASERDALAERLTRLDEKVDGSRQALSDLATQIAILNDRYDREDRIRDGP